MISMEPRAGETDAYADDLTTVRKTLEKLQLSADLIHGYLAMLQIPIQGDKTQRTQALCAERIRSLQIGDTWVQPIHSRSGLWGRC